MQNNTILIPTAQEPCHYLYNSNSGHWIYAFYNCHLRCKCELQSQLLYGKRCNYLDGEV